MSKEQQRRIEQLQVKGISYATPDSVSEDGLAHEVVNLRNVGGAWRPEGKSRALCPTTSFAPLKKGDDVVRYPQVFVHHTHTRKIAVTVSGVGAVGFFDAAMPEKVGATFFSITAGVSAEEGPYSDSVRFEAVGNTLCVLVKPHDGSAPYTTFFRYSEEDFAYTELDKLGVPSLEYYLEEQDEGNPGALYGLGAIVSAYKLSDGSYVNCSAPTLFNYGHKSESGSGSRLYVVEPPYAELVPTSLREVVKSVCIFSTQVSESADFSYSGFGVFYLVKEFSGTKTVGAGSTDKSEGEATGTSSKGYSRDGGNGGGNRNHSIILEIEVTKGKHEPPDLIVFGSQRGNGAGDSRLIRKTATEALKMNMNFVLSLKTSYGGFSYSNRKIRVFLLGDTGSPNINLLGGDNGEDLGNTANATLSLTYNDSVLLPEGAGSWRLAVEYSYYMKDYSNMWTDDYDVTYCSLAGTLTMSYKGTQADDGYKLVNIPSNEVLVGKERLEAVWLGGIYGGASYTYNNRLFLGDVKRQLFSGYTGDDYVNVPTERRGEATAEGRYHPYVYCCYVTRIKTDSGEKVAVTPWEMCVYTALNLDDSFLGAKLPSVLCYPDSRATSISLYMKVESFDNTPVNKIIKVKEFTLVPDYDNNIAYFNCYMYSARSKKEENDKMFPTTKSFLRWRNDKLFAYIDDKNKDVSKAVAGLTVTWPFSADKTITGYAEAPEPKADDVEETVGEVAASAVGQPFYFPNAGSYGVGLSKVVGFTANTVPLDASNFGMYPLFAFTESGIYALEPGVETAIARVSPLNGDIATRGDGIVSTGGATAFISRDGVRLLSGGHSVNITQRLEGLFANGAFGGSDFDFILSQHRLTGANTKDHIQHYLEGARLYYKYKEKELVIMNTDYGYSYVYSMEGGYFRKSTKRFYGLCNSYPSAYGIDKSGGQLYDLTAEDAFAVDEQAKECLIRTGAIKLGTDNFERLRRIAARMQVNAATGLGFYLFVSNDAESWAPVDGIYAPPPLETTTGTPTATATPTPSPSPTPPPERSCVNVGFLSCPASVKHAMLVCAWNGADVRDFFSHFTLEYERRYGGKVR